MLNCLASLEMSTSVLKAMPGKLDIKKQKPSIILLYCVHNAPYQIAGSVKLCCHNLEGTLIKSLKNLVIFYLLLVNII